MFESADKFLNEKENYSNALVWKQLLLLAVQHASGLHPKVFASSS